MDQDPKVDAYIDRSDAWPEEMAALRPILLRCGLSEAIKWGKPCFSHDGDNIVIMQEMKAFLALMFFKGALLDDPDGVLVDQGPNSRSARRIEFTSVDDVTRLADTVAAYVAEAIDVEEAGLEVGPAPEPDLVDELRSRLDADPDLRAAFEGLTPGRRREYNLYFSDAKQSSTRERRVDKYVPKILAGKGFRDR
ncbi:MAG: YdeI/OmpD-associated family protein [Microthrixaceae bacterium]